MNHPQMILISSLLARVILVELAATNLYLLLLCHFQDSFFLIFLPLQRFREILLAIPFC
jgi:hypothetical protein